MSLYRHGRSRFEGEDQLMPVDPHTPVIVGVGQFTERIEDPSYRGMSSVDLATAATRVPPTTICVRWPVASGPIRDVRCSNPSAATARRN